MEDFALPRPAETSIFKALPDGGVLFSTANEVYFGVNAVGARIWDLLPPVCSGFQELIGRLCAEYHDVGADVIRNDARKFIEELIANGLAVPVETGSAPPAPSSSDR